MICNGGEALGETSRFFRGVVMLNDARGVGKMLVVLDEIHLPSPEKAHLFWHTGGKIELDETAHAGRIQGQKAGVHFAIAATAPVESRTGSHKLSYGHADHFVRVTAGVTGPTFFASVFSREPISSLAVEPGVKGAVQVRVGETTLNFQSGKEGLQYLSAS